MLMVLGTPDWFFSSSSSSSYETEIPLFIFQLSLNSAVRGVFKKPSCLLIAGANYLRPEGSAFEM